MSVFSDILDKILGKIKSLVPGAKSLSDVDLTAELDKLAEGKGLQWRVSVVDFLKVIGADSSRENRDALAKELGVDPTIHDIRFVEDNWENPTLGAWGLGWEVWLNGMEVTQFTYFQQVGGLECKPVTGEITYGLERLAMYIQGVDSVYDLVWCDGPLGKTTYGDIYHQNEVEQSTYNFEYANVDFLFTCFDEYEKEAQYLLSLESPLPLPAYERILKAAHTFNLLDARKAISVTERQRYILRIRTLTKGVAEAYYASREALGFPMCHKN